MTAAVFTIICILGRTYPGFVPPPHGMGDELLPLNPRSFAMGGVSAGLAEPVRFSLLNPSASGWAEASGICLGGRYADSDVEAWNGTLGFPTASLQVPLPWGLVLTGAIDARSRLQETGNMVFEDFRGSFDWSGGLEESYAGLAFRACDWFAVSLGGRCTFGNIIADVTLTPMDPGPPVPVNTVYRDDASFRQAWGGQVGVMVNTQVLTLGLSVTTDREGTLDVLRDYSGHGSDSLTQSYGIPGELAAGLSARPLEWLVLGTDIYTRKALNILDSRMDGGSIISAGMEADLGSGLAARAGFNTMSGLWRDGARTITAGGGYSFAGGQGGIDFSAGCQYWRDDQDAYRDETILFFSLWATERWLGD
jgi:hypothetical protein